MTKTLRGTRVARQRKLQHCGRGSLFAGGASLLLAMAHSPNSTAAQAADASADEGGLTEIVVTAEKVKSTIQDTPISISALSGNQLETQGITSVQEIARDVPGISVRSAGPGLTEYDARGLASNGGAAPTVGFYLDEIPLSPPALSQSGKVVIDPGLYDVDRVEVLRGPQGTLYGSGSMGGTVKIVTAQPKLGQFEGSAQVMGSETQGGGGNYSGNLMLNLPLGEVMALRIVGGDVYRSGWINLTSVNVPNAAAALLNKNLTAAQLQQQVYDAPVESNIPRANYERQWNGRATLLFKPSEDFSASLFVMDQSLYMGGYDLLDGSPTSASPGNVHDAHYEVFPQRESLHDDVQIYGLTINANLGFADLTSATSYFTRQSKQGEDASESLYYSNGGAAPLAPVTYYENDPSHQFAQELRLTSHDVGPWHWVGGAFYDGLKSVWNEISSTPGLVYTGGPALANNNTDGSYFTSWNPYWVKQFALFADGSYKITDQLKLAAGLRWYEYHSEQHEFSWGLDAPYNNQGVSPVFITRASDKGFNPRVNLSYEPSHDLNLYATFSKGFRPGGANQIVPTQPPINCQAGVLQFGPDSAYNYEVGEKAKLFDNRLTINGDVYYIRWQGVQQVITLPCGYQYYNNAGDGRAYGPELEISARLTDELTVQFGGSYVDSKITSPTASFNSYLSNVANTPDAGGFPLNSGLGGRPCPATGNCTVPILNVAKDNVSGSLTYSREIVPDYKLTARFDDTFVGPSTDVAYYFGYDLPSYNIANLHLIVEHQKWSINLFVENLTNEVALISANNTSFQFNIPQTVRYSTNQPRTYGTQLNVRF